MSSWKEIHEWNCPEEKINNNIRAAKASNVEISFPVDSADRKKMQAPFPNLGSREKFFTNKKHMVNLSIR